MTVEIIEENLSKSEALAIEKLLINQSRPLLFIFKISECNVHIF